MSVDRRRMRASPTGSRRSQISKTLQSIQKYNYRAEMYDHDSVQRVYVLNDEPALLVCDYGKVVRPKIPFPYYQEAWTGIEYLVAAQFIHAGMLREGLAAIENVRRRYDGERRNPWDEPECGHHYARAMSAWSSVVEWSGFHYHAAQKTLTLTPKSTGQPFRSFWSTGLGWGIFTVASQRVELEVKEGTLTVASIQLGTNPPSVLAKEVVVKPGANLVVTI